MINAAALLDLLETEAYLALIESFGGERVYVPKSPTDRMVDAIGVDAARKLSSLCGGELLPVPLAREFRAAQYRARGESNPQIARRLGLTVRGVEKLFNREPTPRPTRSRKLDPRQTDLFE